MGCASLISVTFGKNVSTLGECVFKDCSGLISVTLENIDSIGSYAFQNCTSLNSVTIPDSVSEIGTNAFDGKIYDTDCKTVLEPTAENLAGSTIRKIDGSWYKYVYSGKCGDNASFTFDIVQGTLNIGGSGQIYDYSDCSMPWNPYKDSIKSVSINGSITTIGSYAFHGCTSITSVTLPESVTSIGGYAFHGCTALVSAPMSDFVTTVGSYAFQNCTSLTSVTLGNSVKILGDGAFSNCSALTTIIVSSSVTSLGNNVFDGDFYDINGETKLDPTAENLAGCTFKKTDGKWIKQNTVPSEDGSDNGSNTTIYLAGGVVAVLAVLGVAVYVLKRRT